MSQTILPGLEPRHPWQLPDVLDLSMADRGVGGTAADPAPLRAERQTANTREMTVSLQIGRRRLLTASAAGALGSFAVPLLPLAETARAVSGVTLTAGRRTLDVNGRAATVFGITQPDATSGLFTEVGTPFRVTLRNDAGADTLIHWHGLKPPYQQDGVPGISAPAVAPGGTAQYDFPLTFPGTFWMHSHQGLQEQALMSAPLIIRDRGGSADRQEVVLMLHDFSFKSPEEIYAGLRHAMSPQAGQGMDQMAGMTGNHMPGMDSMTEQAKGTAQSAPATTAPGGLTGMAGMAMGQSADAGPAGMALDLNDVIYDAFLANDRTLADPQVVRVERGGRILLRVINGSAASNFQIDLGPVQATLVAVDGHPVQPMVGSAFAIAIAQRVDLAFQLAADQAIVPVFAVLEGERKRTGIVLASAGGQVRKLPDLAATAVAPLNFQMEQSLRATAPLPPKAADRVHQIDLTGAMERYVWSLNGLTYGHDKPLMVATGQRVEFVMTNRTMMAHPMHLHGHFFQVVAVDGRRFAGAMRDTVLVPPKQSVTIAFDADNPGRWAFHCHNLYHMEAGMMTTVQYETF